MCVVVSPHPRHGTYHSKGIRNYTYSTYLPLSLGVVVVVVGWFVHSRKMGAMPSKWAVYTDLVWL